MGTESNIGPDTFKDAYREAQSKGQGKHRLYEGQAGRAELSAEHNRSH